MTSKNNDKIITILICLFAVVFGATFKLLPVYYYNQGKNALEKENYINAYKKLKLAYNTNPKNKDYRYYYIEALSNLTPSLPVQKEIFEISSGSEQDSAQQSASQIVADWRSRIYSKFGDNYIEQVPLEGGIIRWDIDKMPLKVSIIDNSNNSALPPYYLEEIKRAFGQWQSSTGIITFELTEHIKKADIIVQILPLPEDICSGNECKYVVGFTTPDYKGKKLKKMNITLYDKDPFGNFFSDKELYNTILHEIGHALGIMGHSYSSGDLMYMSTNNNTNSFYMPYKSSFQYLSSQDINTVKLLYKLLPDITNTPPDKLNKKGLIYPPVILGTSKQISSRKLEEAKNYIKNAPDLASGYIDMGIAYSELNKYSASVKAFEQAEKLVKNNDEKYIVLYNLAAVHLNNNNIDKALNYAHKAQKLSNTDEVQELIMNINHSKKTHNKAFKIKVNE